MKTLLVLRHAKAERDSDSGRDFDRPLASRGRHDAEAIGREMRKRGLNPEAVVASPARRVVETVAAVAEGYGPLRVEHDERLYNASPDALLDVVAETGDGIACLLLVGHNPGLQELVLEISRAGDDGRRDRVARKFPTAALARVDLAMSRWSEIGRAEGSIADLVVPRDD